MENTVTSKLEHAYSVRQIDRAFAAADQATRESTRATTALVGSAGCGANRDDVRRGSRGEHHGPRDGAAGVGLTRP